MTTIKLKPSLLPLILILALAAAALAPASTSFAAARHAAKPAASKKAAAAVATSALPPLAAQTALAANPPALPAKAWLLMDFESGEILASANADEPLPPASLTKMMTSYLVEQALRTGKLKQTDLVTVSQNAWCRGSSTESCMYLPLNSQATVIDILRGIIIQSGNDASKAIAEHMAGSEAGFAKLMNAEAQRLGMTHTNFVNPTGLPDAAHKSSARDLAILARAIIRDSSEYYPIYAEREFKYNGIKQGNRNALLYTDDASGSGGADRQGRRDRQGDRHFQRQAGGRSPTGRAGRGGALGSAAARVAAHPKAVRDVNPSGPGPAGRTDSAPASAPPADACGRCRAAARTPCTAA